MEGQGITTHQQVSTLNTLGVEGGRGVGNGRTGQQVGTLNTLGVEGGRGAGNRRTGHQATRQQVGTLNTIGIQGSILSKIPGNPDGLPR